MYNNTKKVMGRFTERIIRILYIPTILSSALSTGKGGIIDLPRAFKVSLVPFLSALTVIFCLYLMLQLSGIAWMSFGVWMMIGVVVYFLYSRKHSALNDSKKEEDVANL